MREAIRKRLISALQSGQYRQGKKALKYLARDGVPRYCPTGVLCELYEQTTRGRAGKLLPRELIDLHPSEEIYQDLKHLRVKVVFSILGYMALPPDRVLDWAGMTTQEALALIRASDSGKTFKAIARMLGEGTLEGRDEFTVKSS